MDKKHREILVGLLTNPRSLVTRIYTRALSKYIKDDRKYLETLFRLKMQRKLDLQNPKTFNEKIQWLKLYNRRPEYTTMVDKYAAKIYVASIIGEEYIIPTLSVWDKAEDIDISTLPEQFVLKCTHDSGRVFICKDKTKFNFKHVQAKLRQTLKTDYYMRLREYPYKNVPHRIIAEQYMEQQGGGELIDYKFYCFNGEPKFLLVACGRQANDTRMTYFDLKWNFMDLTWGHKQFQGEMPQKPQNFEKMIEIAKQLSADIPHVRVDLYNINGHIYFGELTFFDGSGLDKICPIKFDYIFGDMINLPEPLPMR